MIGSTPTPLKRKLNALEASEEGHDDEDDLVDAAFLKKKQQITIGGAEHKCEVVRDVGGEVGDHQQERDGDDPEGGRSDEVLGRGPAAPGEDRIHQYPEYLRDAVADTARCGKAVVVRKGHLLEGCRWTACCVSLVRAWAWGVTEATMV